MPNFPLLYEVPLLCATHPAYCRVHYEYGHGIMFLQPINVVEIRHWTLMFGNAFRGVHYGELRYLCYLPTLPTYLHRRREGKPKGRESNYIVVKTSPNFPCVIWSTLTLRNASQILRSALLVWTWHYVSPPNACRWNPSLDLYVR